MRLATKGTCIIVVFRKLIGNALDQSGLPSGKGDEISMSKFTYEEFQVCFSLYI